MEGIKVSLDTTGPNGVISLVRVDGVIDTMTATELERVLDSLLKQQKFRIIIDLAGVDYISSAGWGIFISNIREIRAHEGDIKLARMIGSVYEIFELLEFDSILQAYDNIEKARSGFQLGEPAREATMPEVAVAVAERPAREPEIKTEEYAGEEVLESPVAARTEPTVENAGKAALKETVLSLVKSDPFYSIGEITKLVNEGRNGTGEKLVSWWQIWNLLRRNSLLSRKKRFRHARQS
ncbi:MAG: STAS domain-containing protein [bacterium]